MTSRNLLVAMGWMVGSGPMAFHFPKAAGFFVPGLGAAPDPLSTADTLRLQTQSSFGSETQGLQGTPDPKQQMTPGTAETTPGTRETTPGTRDTTPGTGHVAAGTSQAAGAELPRLETGLTTEMESMAIQSQNGSPVQPRQLQLPSTMPSLQLYCKGESFAG